jgi:hypothetical protein
MSLPDSPTEKDAVLAAYRKAFREGFASTRDSLFSDHAGHLAARQVILEREPGIDPTLADSRVVKIISRQLLFDPAAFWNGILDTDR